MPDKCTPITGTCEVLQKKKVDNLFFEEIHIILGKHTTLRTTDCIENHT